MVSEVPDLYWARVGTRYGSNTLFLRVGLFSVVGRIEAEMMTYKRQKYLSILKPSADISPIRNAQWASVSEILKDLRWAVRNRNKCNLRETPFTFYLAFLHKAIQWPFILFLYHLSHILIGIPIGLCFACDKPANSSAARKQYGFMPRGKTSLLIFKVKSINMGPLLF